MKRIVSIFLVLLLTLFSFNVPFDFSVTASEETIEMSTAYENTIYAMSTVEEVEFDNSDNWKLGEHWGNFWYNDTDIIVEGTEEDSLPTVMRFFLAKDMLIIFVLEFVLAMHPVLQKLLTL